MKFDYLREFVTVAQSEDMSLAAQRLGISASALSKHIKAIELEIGESLFIRSRRIVLSQYGRILLPYAQELCALQEEYNTEFGCGKPFSGKLVLGLSPIQIRERVGLAIEEFMLANPTVYVDLLEAGNSELAALLKAGRCDAAFIRSQPTLTRDPALLYLPFQTDRMVVFLPKEHPLAEKKSVSFSALKDEHIILRSEKAAISKVVTEEFEKLGVAPDISYAGSYVEYDMLRRGKGITLYFSPPADPDYRTQYAIVPIEPPVYSFVDFVLRADHPHMQALDAVMQFIRNRYNKTSVL